jgi:hypothetical protein
LQDGYEKFINLDDDNFPINDDFWVSKRPWTVDFVGAHNIVGTEHTGHCLNSANNWFNSGQFLRNTMNTIVYQRGFPFLKRWNDTAEWSATEETGRVALNEGLWLETPDADAINHIITPVRNTAYSSDGAMLLGQKVWTPINTQNSAASREALPAFMFIAGSMMHETNMNRLGDIWCGYLAQRIVQHMKQRTTIGAPLVRHIRNSHNYKQDMMQEMWGMYYMDEFCDFIAEAELFEKSYSGAYAELGRRFISEPVCKDLDMNKFFQRMGEQMVVWAETCEEIM